MLCWLFAGERSLGSGNRQDHQHEVGDGRQWGCAAHGAAPALDSLQRWLLGLQCVACSGQLPRRHAVWAASSADTCMAEDWAGIQQHCTAGVLHAQLTSNQQEQAAKGGRGMRQLGLSTL
jgi:hypothetical protein